MKENPNPLSFQARINPDDFLPASSEEKQSLVIMRESVSFWKDGLRRLKKNRVAMVSLCVILFIMFFSFIVPMFYPYSYEQQIRGSEHLPPMAYSEAELELKAAGESVFPHFLGADKHGRDYAIRVMMGSRVSLIVGLVAAAIILLIGSVFGSVAAFFGGWVDILMMRVVDIIYTIPDVLLIVLLSGLLCYGLSNLISHSATAALLMPILVVVCTAMGDTLAAVGGTSTVLIGVAIASSSAMIRPISPPPNALAYATNLIQQKDMIKMGIIIGAITIVLGYLVLFAAGSLHIV